MSEIEKLLPVGQPRLVRRGWRSFLCDECGHKFEWPTRDHKSPSGENCPECGEWLFPHDSRQDETLKVDDMGNLTYDLDVFPPTNATVEQPALNKTK